jgi:hypothetical protein
MENYFGRLAGRVRRDIPLAQPIIPAVTSVAPSWEPTGVLNQVFSETHTSTSARHPADSAHSLNESLPPHEVAIAASPRAHADVAPVPEDRNTGADAVDREPPPPENHVVRTSVISRVIPSSKLSERGPSGIANDRRVRTAARVPLPQPILETQIMPANVVAGLPLSALATPPSVTTRVRPSSPQHSGSFQAEAPVIRVTIGRVEVRAQFPPPTASPAPVKPKRTSILSLEEYAKQRREGRR